MGSLKQARQMSTFDLTYQFHHLFFFGDLNYRIDLPAMKIVQQATEQDYEELMKEEQLQKEKKHGKVFVGFCKSLSGWALSQVFIFCTHLLILCICCSPYFTYVLPVSFVSFFPLSNSHLSPLYQISPFSLLPTSTFFLHSFLLLTPPPIAEEKVAFPPTYRYHRNRRSLEDYDWIKQKSGGRVCGGGEGHRAWVG